MKKMLTVSLLGVVSVLPSVAQAQNSALSFNASVTTDYRYRGISQSRLKPAVQGGVDYSLPKGFYVGAWGSTIRWIKDAGKLGEPHVDTGRAPIEIDLYGGYKAEIQKGLSYDVGLLQYVYPRNHYSNLEGAKNANTTELYGALTFGPATVKYSHSLTTLFGNANSKNSGYIEVAASFEVGGGVTLVPHVGRQRVANNSIFSYTDYSLTASKELAGFGLSATLVATDTKRVDGSYAYSSPSGKNLGRAGLVLAVKKTF